MSMFENKFEKALWNLRFVVILAVILSIVASITLFVIVVSYMFSVAPKLTMYTLTPLPILSIIIYKISKIINIRSKIVQEYLSKLTTFTQEAFSGVKIIKTYTIEDFTNKKLERLADDSKEKNMSLVKIQAWFFPLMILLIGISNVIVVYIGGNQYMKGEIELGVLAEFIIYVNMLTWPVAIVGWVSSMVQQAEASQGRINEFLKQEPQIINHTEENHQISGHIVFDKVSFTYPDTKIKALNEVSFKVAPGETLAIIGHTGSGKSTLLELIARLYDVDSGTYTMDGLAAKSINLNDLRNAIGYVPQDAFLFSESILDNIKFGKADATQEEIESAAKRSVVHENIINFKDGYHTVLGERGITLSGGQKQRVSIARALIKDAQILLLDDCLSAVDTETEEAILHHLLEYSQNKTTIIVSHRVSTVKNADRILVLDHGAVIQEGSHDELLKAHGYYKELYEKQLVEKEL